MSQEKIVMNQIKETGSVSRNWCLSNHITRLSAIIYTLKNGGYKFKTSQRNGRGGGDYIYTRIR